MSYPLRSAPATSVRPPRAHARLGPRRRVVIIMSSGTRSGCVRVRSQLHGAISPSPHHASSSESSLGRRTAVCSAARCLRRSFAFFFLIAFIMPAGVRVVLHTPQRHLPGRRRGVTPCKAWRGGAEVVCIHIYRRRDDRTSIRVPVIDGQESRTSPQAFARRTRRPWMGWTSTAGPGQTCQ